MTAIVTVVVMALRLSRRMEAWLLLGISPLEVRLFRMVKARFFLVGTAPLSLRVRAPLSHRLEITAALVNKSCGAGVLRSTDAATRAEGAGGGAVRNQCAGSEVATSAAEELLSAPSSSRL